MRRFEVTELRHHPLLSSLRHASRRLGLWALSHFVEEAGRSMWRSRAMTAFAIVIIGLSLATVGAFLLVLQNLGGVIERLSSLDVPVYFRDGTSAQTIEAARAAVAAEPGVRAVRVVTADEALAEFRRLNPKLAEVADSLGENPLPAALEVTLDPEARTSAALAGFAHQVESLAGVDHVGRDFELAERFSAASRVFRLVAFSLGGVLLLSALFTVSNVVKLTAYARRQEVEILRLVGATTSYIRGTFVMEGLLQGLSGSCLGLLLLFAVHRAATGYLASSGLTILASLATDFLSGSSIGGILATGASLGAIGSWTPLSKIARG